MQICLALGISADCGSLVTRLKCFEVEKSLLIIKNIRLIRTALVKYLEDSDLLPDDQHAYIKDGSTLPQLLNHIGAAFRKPEESKATDPTYLEFAKAFNKIDHDIFCHKLNALGFSGRLGIWIRKFLVGKFQ